METHEEMIAAAHQKLMDAMPNCFTLKQLDLIESAYYLAKEAHGKQFRNSGLPYILHPLAVSLIVVKEMRQRDAAVICAALLHDVVEDTEYTIEDITVDTPYNGGMVMAKILQGKADSKCLNFINTVTNNKKRLSYVINKKLKLDILK